MTSHLSDSSLLDIYCSIHTAKCHPDFHTDTTSSTIHRISHRQITKKYILTFDHDLCKAENEWRIFRLGVITRDSVVDSALVTSSFTFPNKGNLSISQHCLHVNVIILNLINLFSLSVILFLDILPYVTTLTYSYNTQIDILLFKSAKYKTTTRIITYWRYWT